MTISKIVCYGCGFKTVYHSNSTTGYGRDNQDNLLCFDCCGKIDESQMNKEGKTVLYFSNGYVSNWPGTLKIKIDYCKSSWHNIGRTRQDFWFNFNGHVWHGYQIGQNNEIAYCKRTKQEVK